MKNIDSKLSKAIMCGLAVAVVFSALAHGAIEAWSAALLELIIIVLIFIYGIRMANTGWVAIKIPKVAWPLIALTMLGVLQSLSIRDAAGRRMSLSLDVEATRSTVLALLTLLAAMIIAANTLNSPERLSQWAHFLMIYGFLFALFAFIQNFTWNGLFFWFRKPMVEEWELHRPAVLGPFINHNHFAGYMEMLMPIPVGLVLTRAVGGLCWLCGFAAMVMGMAAIASLSRGGAISLFAELLFLLVMSTRLSVKRVERMRDSMGNLSAGSGIAHSSSRGLIRWTFMRGFSTIPTPLIRIGTIGLITLAILVGAIWIDAEPIFKRIAETQPALDTFFGVRGWMWRDAAAVFWANPIVGAGLGAFATAAPIYSYGDGIRVPKQAHNDYLQVLADGGIIGGMIALWFIIVAAQCILRGIRSRVPLMAGLAMGCGAGIVGLLVHSFFDFNLHLPSNALLFLILTSIISLISSNVAAEEAARQRSSNT